jgi:hypothetical protein
MPDWAVGHENDAFVSLIHPGPHLIQAISMSNHAPAIISDVSKFGDELLVNTQTAGQQSLPRAAALVGGGFVITWTDESGTLGDPYFSSVKAQVYAADGTKVGTELLVNSQVLGWQGKSSVASLSDGGFIISWEDSSGALGDASGEAVRAQRFDASGARVGDEFLVNTTTFGDQMDTVTIGLANGGFAVAWVDYNGVLYNSSASSRVDVQLYDAAGAKLGSEITVTSSIADAQLKPQLTGLANGDFCISWRDTGTSIKAQLYGASGTKVGTEIAINTNLTANEATLPVISGLANGGFVAAWVNYGTDGGGRTIVAQIFNANAQKVGGEFIANSTTVGEQDTPVVSSLAEGGFVISWHDFSGTLGDATGTSVKAQVFDNSGTKIGGELLVNTQTLGDQLNPTVIGLKNGDFAIAWQDGASWVSGSNTLGDTSNGAIKAQVFSFANTSVGITEKTTAITTVHAIDPDPGTTLTYSIAGGTDAGKFRINPSTGELSFKSSPTFDAPADAGHDNIYDIVVQASDGVLTDTQAIAVTVFKSGSGPAGSTITGNSGVDTLTGDAGDDVLNGRSSIDSMDGKDGSDIYVITGSSEHKAAEIHDTGTSGSDEVRFSAAKSDTLKIFAGDTGIERVVIGTGTAATADSSGTLALNIDASKAVNGLTIIGNAGVNKLTGTAFSDTIDGGAGADKMSGGAGDDTYIVDNVKDAISEKAAGGTDTAMSSVGYKLASNVENLTLAGSANIGGTGNSAANTIVGNDGNNTLFGGLGNDTLTGGAGADAFVFNTKVNAVTNVDAITDFSSSGGDHLQFSLKLFKALGAAGDLTSDQFWSGAGVTTAHDATDRLIYNTTSGNLYYDPDGVAVRYAAVLVANLSGNPALAYGDIQIIA